MVPAAGGAWGAGDLACARGGVQMEGCRVYFLLLFYKSLIVYCLAWVLSRSGEQGSMDLHELRSQQERERGARLTWRAHAGRARMRDAKSIACLFSMHL